MFGITRNRDQAGWVLPIEGNRLLGPVNLLSIPAGAVEQQAILEVAGQEIALDGADVKAVGQLARLSNVSLGDSIEC